MNKRFSVAASVLFTALTAGVAWSGSQPSPEAGRHEESLFSAMTWRTIGPYRGGRVTTVAGLAASPLPIISAPPGEASGKRSMAANHG